MVLVKCINKINPFIQGISKMEKLKGREFISSQMAPITMVNFIIITLMQRVDSLLQEQFTIKVVSMGQEQGKNYSFKGHFHSGKRTKGVLFWNNDSNFYSYNGQFNEDNQFHGKGVLTQPEGKYQGDFKNGEKHGNGTYHYMNGSKYVGTYVHGVREGQGTIYHGNRKIAYKGGIKNDLPHGKGFLYNKQGKPVQSEWIQGIDKRTITE